MVIGKWVKVNMRLRNLFLLIIFVLFIAAQTIAFGQLPESGITLSTEPNLLPPFPEIPAKQPINSVEMGDWKTFPEIIAGILAFIREMPAFWTEYMINSMSFSQTSTGMYCLD